MTSVGHSRWPRQTGLWVALFTVALLLRTGMVFYVNQSYNTFQLAPDSKIYDQLAQSLAAGQGYMIGGDHREYTRIAPVFPVYLAVLYRLFGRSVHVVGYANALLGSLTCLVIYGIARKVVSPWAAALAALLTAAYWEFLLWTPFVLKETLALFLFTGAILLIVNADRGSRALALAGGVVLGLAGLARYVSLGFVPFLVGALVFSPGRKRLQPLVVPVLVGVIIALSPWLVRNYLVFGEVLLTNHGPVRQLYLTYGPGKVRDTRGYAGVEGLDLQAIEQMDRTPSPAGRERLYLRELSEGIRQPGRIARLFTAKIVNMWRPTWAKFRFSIRIPFAISYFGLLALGLLGLVLYPRVEGRFSLLHLVLLYYVAVHSVWWAEIRNRVYLMPYLIVFGAYSVQRAVERVRAPRPAASR